MKAIFDDVSLKVSKLTTNSYSTSFSHGIRLLARRFHNPIYAIYGFVRAADEIVDSFHDYDKKKLLDKFRADTYEAIEEGISLNPILNSFQYAVREYKIERQLIDDFLKSMETDLYQNEYDQLGFEDYIWGSAEVVGLMCLRVFCEGDEKMYDNLKMYACRLGSAFQKINFLRDLRADYLSLGRAYFPDLNVEQFDDATKQRIEADIEEDFRYGYEGVKRLPAGARLGVYIAYKYYYSLFQKIRSTPSSLVMSKRIRIPNNKKYSLMLGSLVRYQLNWI